MDNLTRHPRPLVESSSSGVELSDGEMDDLVERLGKRQAVRASIRPEPSLELFRAAFERGYVHILFDATDTELGVTLDRSACRASPEDFARAKGTIELVGELVLDYNRVRYRGTLELESLRGEGQLEFIADVTPGSSSG
jgi:hypothetical protein